MPDERKVKDLIRELTHFDMEAVVAVKGETVGEIRNYNLRQEIQGDEEDLVNDEETEMEDAQATTSVTETVVVIDIG